MRAIDRGFDRRITKNNINTTQKPQENKLTDVGLCGNIKLATTKYNNRCNNPRRIKGYKTNTKLKKKCVKSEDEFTIVEWLQQTTVTFL